MSLMELYESNKILTLLSEEIISFSRKQNFNKASRLFSEWISKTSDLAQNLVEYKADMDPDGAQCYENQLILNLKEILTAQENQDYILLADLMELNYLPFIYGIQDITRNVYFLKNNTEMQSGQNIELSGKHYETETTSSGYLTLRITKNDKSFYMCGNVNPLRDAEILFDQYKTYDADSYIVYGLELGYLLTAINRSIGNAVPVTVYESDENIIELAKTNCFVTNVINGYGDYRIVLDKDFSEFSKAIVNRTEKDILIIHYPSIQNISNPSIREKMEDLFIQDSSVRNQIVDILANVKSNIKSCNHYVDELEPVIRDKDVYVVAAGPSLDNNIELLKNRASDSVVICVGRAYKKLMNSGITPDYVVYLDSAERIYGQFAGCEENKVPLILAASACKKIGVMSKADKYLACQEGLSEAEEYARVHNYATYNTGGSVATISFDIAVKLGAKRIIVLGLDLSYKDGKTHADGSFSRNIGDETGLISVKGMNGEIVYTTKAMDMYRVWFEEKINEVRLKEGAPEFINATEGGVEIKGMKNMRLKDVVR